MIRFGKWKAGIMEIAILAVGILAIVSHACAQGTIPGVISSNIDISTFGQYAATAAATWVANQGLKQKSPFFNKFLSLLSPFVGAAIWGAVQGAQGGITGSGHIGADIGHGALTGLIGGALAVFGHEAIGQHVVAGLSTPPQP